MIKKKSQNSEIKSRNNFFSFFIQWQKRASIVRWHTFTFMHLSDAFIQSDLQYVQVIHLYCQYMCSLGIEPTTFALLTQCSTTEPQEHIKFILNVLFSFSQEELENFPLATVHHCQTLLNQTRYPSVLLLICQDNEQHKPDIHFFYCDEVEVRLTQTCRHTKSIMVLEMSDIRCLLGLIRCCYYSSDIMRNVVSKQTHNHQTVNFISIISQKYLNDPCSEMINTIESCFHWICVCVVVF